MREEGKLQSLVFSQSPPSLSVHYTADIYMIHVLIAHSTQFIVLYEAKVHISKQYYSVLTHVIVVPVQPIPCTVQAAHSCPLGKETDRYRLRNGRSRSHQTTPLLHPPPYITAHTSLLIIDAIYSIFIVVLNFFFFQQFLLSTVALNFQLDESALFPWTTTKCSLGQRFDEINQPNYKYKRA